MAFLLCQLVLDLGVADRSLQQTLMGWWCDVLTQAQRDQIV